MAARLGGGLLLALVVATCIAAARVPGGSAQKAPAPPTKAQLRAELQAMTKSIVKRYPQYSRYAQDASKYINLARKNPNLIPFSSHSHPSSSTGGSRYAQDASKYINLARKNPNLIPFSSHSHPSSSTGGSRYAQDASKSINRALNSRYDLSALRDASILIPNNAHAEALAKRIPAKSSSIPTVYNITAFHILRKRMTVPQLRQVKQRVAVGTQLRQPVFKMTAANSSAVSFAKGPYLKQAQWTTIRIPGLYVGRWFIAHGVDRMLIPTHTKI
ncbi:hypothetical protein CLOM_g8900 [Closterium sp. NIES-68]|nr:hypothetical protein CLOM_g2397 [Closterium sp. NIES-68]GJP49722.1 hypothetical protein CLOM_g8900 [Closterium sp. NIES-68]GJP74967.1 hypothetical protein CLOP_g5473 [Closterium sp. NIES-67]